MPIDGDASYPVPVKRINQVAHHSLEIGQESALAFQRYYQHLGRKKVIHHVFHGPAERPRRIEGFLQPGARVVIVDDVCTTGGSTITAIEAAREASMTVAGVLCLVDREQGGRANIEAAIPGVPFLSVFTAADVRRAHIALHPAR